jgi:hypothetical protein
LIRVNLRDGHPRATEALPDEVTDEQKAERIIQAGLAKTGWRVADLSQRRKRDPLKLRWAAQLRRATPLTLKWIAARLKMGTWKHLNWRLHEPGKPKE